MFGSNNKDVRLLDNVIAKEKKSLPTAGTFEKVSFNTFCKFVNPSPNDEQKEQIKKIYDSIIIPKRQSKDSPIYNIYFPFGDTLIVPNQSIVVYTGIKVKLNTGWYLQCTINPLLAMNNDLLTHEIITYITGDRYNNKNDEGMISFEIINTNRFGRSCVLTKDTRLCSCIFSPYGLDSANIIE